MVETKVGQEQLTMLLNAIQVSRNNNKSSHNVKGIRYHNNKKAASCEGEIARMVDTDSVDNSTNENKRLKSGKCTKPDESDIKRVVKYAHEKLDVKHVQNRTFDSLPLHLLIAGEVEIMGLESTSIKEKEARLGIIKVLAYHKQYLNDSELREGYDYIFKKVERGCAIGMSP